MFKKVAIYIIFGYALCNLRVGFAQLPHYSINHTNLLYQNPALAGIKHIPVVTVSRQMRYLRLNGGLSSTFVSVDAPKVFSQADGGIIFQSDIQNTIYSNTLFQLAVAKRYSIDRKTFFKIGMAFGINHSSLKTDGLVYSSMLNTASGQYAKMIESLPTESKTMLVVEPAFLVYNREFIAGMAIKNMQSIFMASHNKYVLPAAANMYIAYEISTTNGFANQRSMMIYPIVSATFSRATSYINLSAVAQKNVVQFGARYKHNFPLDAESFGLLIGFFEKKYKFAYNCDVTINSYSFKNFNTHEVSLSYYVGDISKKRKFEAIRAPDF